MEAQIMSSSLGAMGPLLAKLHQLLDSYEYQLPKPLPPREQIEHLITVLEEIYALLADLSREQAPSTMAKLWMDEVRDLSYEVEDYIDKTTHRHYDAGEEIPFDSEVEEFSTHVEQANDARARYDRYVRGRWASNPSFMVYGRAHVPTLSGEAAGLVGMGDLGSKLISWLRDDAEQLKKVVPILGPAGVGKTTLAQEVYRQIGGHFDCRAFVQASQTPDTRRLLRSMISQVQRHEQLPYAYTVQDLKDKLRGHLQRKRYFIVIDGLWETSSWDIVRSAFPEGTHCSRILVTTDIKEVALECCDYHSDGIFQMEQLGGKYPTELFFKRVFGSSKDECPEHLQKDSEEIIRTCDGLPLAIIMISSILSCEPANSELWKHVKECLSCSMKTNFTLKDMLSEIVLLSYNNLPNHLKTCLLYLSLYPEGYTFLKVDLVKQWTAEGFTSAAGKKGTNQDAEDFFDELVCRGLIQPYHINFPEEVMFYTVHSTVFEVIRNKSREDNFTTVVDYSNMVRQLSKKARRLSLIFSNSRYAKKPEGIKLSPVRSLNFYGLIECFPSMMKFEVLRVLVLELWGALEELDLSSINTLFQLRYLRIRTNVSVKLPAKMRDLKYLETLEIYARVTSVPSDIVDLSRLLHLCLPGEINLSNGIGHMKSLRSLQSFDLSSNSESNVRRLTEMIDLQYLHLTCSTEMSILLERNLVALASSLGEHGQLKSLVLEPGAGASCTSIYLDCSSSVSSPPVFLQRLELLPPLCIFSRLPKWIGRLRKLCTLKIALRELTSYDVSSITGLQELTVLSLYVSQPTAKSIIFNCAAFPVLKYFKLSCGILRLAFQAKAMPNLRWLNLKFNAHKQEQYGNMVAGIEHLLNLEEIAVRIGAGPGAEESDRTTAESAIKETICRHPRPLSISIRRVDSIVEDLAAAANKTRKGSAAASWGMKGDSSRQSSLNDNSQISSAFPSEPKLEFLKNITKDFSSEREVGHGAFGVVYKGILQSGQLVAVKKLVRTSGVHDRRFQNEAGNLQTLEHRNIVKLLGSCCQVEKKLVERNGRHFLSDVPEKILCYEYLSNGSLDKYIYDESCGLDWAMRFKIILGICNGLHFLHEERSKAIIHLNLKPSNIMLGDDMAPKIADFGLSRLFGEEQTRILTQNVVGWIGYIAPEYYYRGEISVKSDIFSLGVLILEIVTGLKRDLNIQDISSKFLIDNVSKNWTKMSRIESKYPSLEEQHMLQVKRCIELGLNCMETDPKKRPTVGSIIGKLEEISHEASIHKFMEKKLQLITEFPREPKLHFVEEITGNFANEREIGKGSFGVVYKGMLQNGEVVAVKKLLVVPEINLDKQFTNEVFSLIDLNHRNIVKLIGYCYEIHKKLVESHGRYVFADTQERILCYEYLPRGSLDKYIYGASHEFNWSISFKIIQGICQGLQFLHELQRPIIHMDLKPGNILLDDNLMPKIADFGLSRLFGEEQTRTLTSNVVGARGYMAPEYYYRGEVSAKSDIYSLGILIIEIVTGLKVDSNTEDLSSKNLIDNVQKTWTKMPQIASKYPTLEASSLQQVKRCIDVGLNCVSENPKERPSIGKIMEQLNGNGFPSSS